MEDVKGKVFVNARAIIERTVDGKKEVIIQYRTKYEEYWKFPGGRVEPFESLYDALKREVKEETGLDVIAIQGENGYFREGRVECTRPFCIYQTLEGYVDSIGFHFICHAAGEPLSEGDGSKDVKWIGLCDLSKLIEDGNFGNMDQVAAMLYLKENSNFCP